MPKRPKIEKEETFEKCLWKAADKLRKPIDAAGYQHIVLGLRLIFLKSHFDALEFAIDPKDLKADFAVASRPFNNSDRSGEPVKEGARWKVTGKTCPLAYTKAAVLLESLN